MCDKAYVGHLFHTTAHPCSLTTFLKPRESPYEVH